MTKIPERPAERRRLRVLRAEVGLTQRETAYRAKIGMDRYWRIETGWADPTEDERAAIAKVLKATPAEAFPEVTA